MKNEKTRYICLIIQVSAALCTIFNPLHIFTAPATFATGPFWPQTYFSHKTSLSVYTIAALQQPNSLFLCLILWLPPARSFYHFVLRVANINLYLMFISFVLLLLLLCHSLIIFHLIFFTFHSPSSSSSKKDNKADDINLLSIMFFHWYHQNHGFHFYCFRPGAPLSLFLYWFFYWEFSYTDALIENMKEKIIVSKV